MAGGWLNRRGANLLGVFACAAMLAYAWYSQTALGFEPCPLCMFQRVGILALGLTFLIAALHHPRGRTGARIYAFVIPLVALAPLYVSGRHVYIQSLPPGSVPSCGASLDFMLDVFPLVEVIGKVLTGGGECAVVDWTFLGLSMPAWVFLCALVLAGVGALGNTLLYSKQD